MKNLHILFLSLLFLSNTVMPATQATREVRHWPDVQKASGESDERHLARMIAEELGDVQAAEEVAGQQNMAGVLGTLVRALGFGYLVPTLIDQQRQVLALERQLADTSIPEKKRAHLQSRLNSIKGDRKLYQVLAASAGAFSAGQLVKDSLFYRDPFTPKEPADFRGENFPNTILGMADTTALNVLSDDTIDEGHPKYLYKQGLDLASVSKQLIKLAHNRREGLNRFKTFGKWTKRLEPVAYTAALIHALEPYLAERSEYLKEKKASSGAQTRNKWLLKAVRALNGLGIKSVLDNDPTGGFALPLGVVAAAAGLSVPQAYKTRQKKLRFGQKVDGKENISELKDLITRLREEEYEITD